MTEKPTYEELEKKIQGLEQVVSDFQKSGKTLQESKDRFRLLYERAPLAYQSLDEDGNFIEVNSFWLNTLGYSRKEVLGRSFGDFLHPDWTDHFKENFSRFKTIGEVLGVEFEMVKKDGSLMLVSLHGKIGKDQHENFQQTYCIFQDITERKKMENSLQLYSHNLGERVKELNCLHEISKLIELTDISFEKIFQGIVCLIPPAFLYPDNTCSRIVINEREYKTENFKKTKWSLNHDIFVHGECVGVLEVYCLEEKTGMDKHPFLKEETDLINNISNRLGRIIEHKMTQENLRKSENRYQVIMDSMIEPIYICSQKFVIEYMNATMAKRIDRDAIGEKCFKAIHGFDKKCSWCNYEAIKKGDAYQLSIVSPKDNHSFDISATPIINNDGSVSILNVFRDVTKIKKMELQLQQAQKMESIGTLAGV